MLNIFYVLCATKFSLYVILHNLHAYKYFLYKIRFSFHVHGHGSIEFFKYATFLVALPSLNGLFSTKFCQQLMLYKYSSAGVALVVLLL